jgi:hypothetical protein
MTDALVPAQSNALSFGQTALRADQFIPPRIKIVQAMSAERATGLAQAGDFFNTLTSENYGPSLKFLPLQPFMNRVLLVRDERRAKIEAALTVGKDKFLLSEGDGLKCRSNDMVQGNGEPGIACEECPLSRWGAGNTAPLCTEVYNVAALHELGGLIILQFQKSSAKTGKKMFSMIRFAPPGRAVWSQFYRADTHEESIKGKGTFAVPIVTILPEVPPTELLRQAQHWAQQLAGIGPIDVTPIEDDEEEVSSAEAPF